jgi:hypothetical protein
MNTNIVRNNIFKVTQIDFLKTIEFLALGLICLVLLISYFNFAPIYTDVYNSDHAIHVLMAENPTFKDDLYYWGQRRLGSIVPYLGFLYIQLFDFLPIVATGLSQYTILGIGFIFLYTFFKSNVYRLLFALVLFFPPIYFREMVSVGHPYSGQFLTLAIFG